MVERYQQKQLASQVVGTPGLDTSAGQGSLAIAQASDQMRAQETQMGIASAQQAESLFNKAGALFHQWSSQKSYDKRLAQAQENENRRQQVQFDMQDENDAWLSRVGAIKEQYKDNPRGAMQELQKAIPQIRADFAARYQDDPKRMRMLMSNHRQNEMGAMNELKNWGNQTEKANLTARLNLMPEQISGRIASLSGSLNDQLKGFQEQITGANAIYDNLRLKAPTQGEHDEIFLKQLKVQQAASKDFADHLLAQTPEGEAGLSHLDDVHKILSAPQANGLRLSPDVQKEMLGAVSSMRHAHEGEVVQGIQSDSALRVLDANRVKFDLYQAADSPAEMQRIARRVNQRMTDLDTLISQVAKEPDSRVKTAKLAGLKQEQSAYISETGQELKQQRQFDQLQRTLTSFAQSQVRFQQSQIGFAHGMTAFAQGQQRFSQWQMDLAERNDKKAETAVHTEVVDKFNKTWAGVQNEINAAWSLPVGPKQKEAMQNIAKKTVPILQNALMNGAVNGDGYKSHLDSLSSAVEKSSMHKVTEPIRFGPVQWGGGQVVPLKDKERDKAALEAKAAFGQIVARQQTNFVHQDNAIKQLQTMTTSKAEKAFLTQWVNSNLPRLMNSQKFQNFNAAQQSKTVADTVNKAVRQFREKSLR